MLNGTKEFMGRASTKTAGRMQYVSNVVGRCQYFSFSILVNYVDMHIH